MTSQTIDDTQYEANFSDYQKVIITLVGNIEKLRKFSQKLKLGACRA